MVRRQHGKQGYLELRNCVLADAEEPTTIVIQGELIRAIGPTVGGNEPFIDCEGLWILPGLVDIHVHDRGTPGEADKEDWPHLQRTAFAGGVTTVCPMPNHGGDYAVVDEHGLQNKVERIGNSQLNFLAWVAATVENRKRIRDFRRHPRFAGMKLYEVETTGGIYVAKYDDQLAILGEAAEADVTVAVHVGDQEMLVKNKERYTRVSDHCHVHSTAMEVAGAIRTLKAAKKTGARVHICHVSCPEVMVVINAAKAEGVRVTSELCPQYVVLNNGMVSEGNGGRNKVNPSLRTEEQVAGMIEHLRHGDADVIATDHAPHRLEQKQGFTYGETASGMPGLQEMLGLMLQFVRRGVITLSDLIRMTATNPAQIMGFKDRGQIRVGYRADIVGVNPQEDTVYKDETSLSKCGWTAYHGHKGAGAIEFVLVGGRPVYP